MGWFRDILGLETVKRVEPLEGTNMSLWNSIIPDWWSQNVTATMLGTPQLNAQIWVCDRCIQMNAQQIASMPLKFEGATEPMWVNAPDPNWYPNGIGDALHSIVDQIYRWGFSCQYITDFYADGFPRTWTVLDSAKVSITAENGSRKYKIGETVLDPARVVQVDRNPGTALHGTSAIKAYAQLAYGLLAAGNQALTVNQGGTPKFYLKSERKLTRQQAQDLQEQWMTSTAARNGAPPVVPPEITPTEMSFDPAKMALIESQEFAAKALATAFGIPSVLLNMALQGGLTYQNPGALGEMWWRFELRPTVTRIVNAFSAQMLPRGQWVWSDARDTFLPLDETSDEDDPQLSQVAKASPAQQPGRLTAIGGGG